MGYLWDQFRHAIPLITKGDSQLWGLAWVTIKVAVISTACALVIGLPIGLTLGLGRFRGRRTLQILANATLAFPSVVVGVGVLLLVLPQGALGSMHIAFSLTAVYIAQTVIALPYVIALTPAAIQGLPPGLLDQARALGASRIQLSALALREARIGVIAAVIAAMGAAVSEVGAVVIVGGNTVGQDQTLGSALLAQVDYYGSYPQEIATGLVLLGLILALLGSLTFLQQSTGGFGFRFRAA
jgi:tungstate transport system permease protein